MNNLIRLSLLLMLLALLPPGARAEAGPDAFVPGLLPPSPPAFAQAARAPAGATLAAAQVCAPALADSPVDAAPTPWQRLLPSVAAATLDTAQSYSSPQSLKLQIGGNAAIAVGQTALPISAAATAIYGSLWYRYAAGTAQAGDQLQVELLRDGTISLLSPAFPVSFLADDTWHQFSWSITDPAQMASLRGQGSLTFQVAMRNSAGGGTRSLWLDDLTMDVCLAGIDGRVRVAPGDAGLPGAQILLAKNTGASSAIVASATSDAAGGYSFTGLPALDSGSNESYQVWFLNAPTGASRPDTRLGFWAGPTVSASQLLAQPTLTVADMVVGDIVLGGPASYSEVVATDASPATLSWAKRGLAGETYQLCVYDPQRIDPATQLPAQACGPKGDSASFALAPQSFSGVPAFGFSYGHSYRWYVVAYGADGQYGYSFYERAITLLSEASAPPTALVTPAATPPAAASATADWTLMVYAAGDNLLGDPRRATRLALLDNQLAQLRGLAASYPRLHLVTLSDAYGDTGAQLCYLPPTGAADCQQQGEIDTGDPATLGGFVQATLARYPASHSMLIIAGPGDPIGGVGRDLTTPGAPSIDVAGLRAAYAAAGLGPSAQLDIVFYQAPLMGNIAVAAATAPYAKYMVAAADEYWHMPLYDAILPLLSGAQQGQPAEVAKSLVTTYSLALAGMGTNLACSIAAYDLSRAAGVRDALNTFGGELQAALVSDSTTLRAALRRVRQNAIAYDSSGNGLQNALGRVIGEPLAIQEDALVDIRGVASAIQGEAALPQSLRGAAGALAIAISGGVSPLVLASTQRSGVGVAGRQVALSGAAGVSAFFPTGVRLGGQPTLAQLYLYGASGEPRDGAWAGFLRAYLASEVGRGPGGVTAGPAGGAQFRGPAGGLINLDLLLPLVSRP